MQENMKEYLTEKEAREKRLEIYTEKIQEKVLKTTLGVRPHEIPRSFVRRKKMYMDCHNDIRDVLTCWQDCIPISFLDIQTSW